MSIPLKVTFRHMDHSDALHQHIEKHAAKLERFADDVLSCDVVVEAVDHRHRKGNLYNVHVHLTRPGGVLDAGRTKADDHSHEDAYIAVRDAFKAMGRRLEDFVRKQRGDVKHQPAAKKEPVELPGLEEGGL